MKRTIKLSIFIALGILFNNTKLTAQWSLTGNASTNPATNYIGTSDNQPLVFRTNATEAMRLLTSGRLGIGTTTPAYPLQIGTTVSAGSISSGGNFSVCLATTTAGVGEQSTDKHAVFGALGTNKDILFPTYNGSSFDERMRITSTGNVGIGTASPNIIGASSAFKTLSILGPNTSASSCGILELATQSTDAASNFAGVLSFVASANATGKKSIAEIVALTEGTTATNRGGYMAFNTKPDASSATVERMRITNTGNVGVGTNSPQVRLHSVCNANNLRLEGTDHTFMEFFPDGPTTRKAWFGFGGASDNNITLTNEIGGAHIILSPTSGNVGVGTGSPAQKLDVAGTVQMTGFKLPTGATNGYVLTSNASGVGTWTAAGSGTISGSCSSGANYIPKMSSTTAITCSQIYDDGTNVGIGTTTPGAKLDVEIGTGSSGIYTAVSGQISAASSLNYGGYFEALGSSSTNRGLVASASNGTTNTGGGFSAYGGTTNMGIVVSASSGTTNKAIYIGEPYAGTNNYAIYSDYGAKSYFSGSIGIGTTTPGSKLDVNGTSNFTGNMTVTGNVSIIGNCTRTGTDNFTSDQMFKTNIDSIPNALAVIKQLKPKTYYFDTTNVYGLNFPSKKNYGFVAQDLEQVLPELVSTNSKAEVLDTLGNVVHPAVTYKGVYYVELIAFLTKGIQELQQKNDSLQSKVNKQDSVNTALQNQLVENNNNQNGVNTSVQNQLNQLMSVITNCCNHSQSLMDNGNNGNTKSMSIDNVQQGEATQIDVKLNDVQTVILEQNVPNPFSEQTTVNYTLPDNTTKAQMLFYNSQGKLIQTVELTQSGKGQLNVFASDLSSGIYTYTLVVNGKIIDTKKMIKN